MSVNIFPIKSDGKVWGPTMSLRFVTRFNPNGAAVQVPMRVLQQLWKESMHGETEWRDIPLVVTGEVVQNESHGTDRPSPSPAS